MRIYVQLKPIDEDFGDEVISAMSLTPFKDNCYYIELTEASPIDKLIWYEDETTDTTNLIPYNGRFTVLVYKNTKSGKIITKEEFHELPDNERFNYTRDRLYYEFKEGELFYKEQ